jgi:NAD(P)-dependent dehydrogenase (short-subunit alcohol dehydrogenase family)
MLLKEKIALVTGGSSGIGLETAKLFAKEGARVVITGRDKSRLREAAKEIGSEAIEIAADVCSQTALAEAAAQLTQKVGRLDVLFVNAGVAFATPLASTEEALYDHIMDINVKGAFFTVKAFTPLMPAGSSIIMNTSWLAEVGTAGLSVLSASKAAVRSFTRTLAAELLPSVVRVNAVSPGAIMTPIHSKTGMSEEELAAFAARLQSKIPMGRFGTSLDIANAALFLASPASQYMNGAEIAVDGGFAQL